MFSFKLKRGTRKDSGKINQGFRYSKILPRANFSLWYLLTLAFMLFIEEEKNKTVGNRWKLLES